MESVLRVQALLKEVSGLIAHNSIICCHYFMTHKGRSTVGHLSYFMSQQNNARAVYM